MKQLQAVAAEPTRAAGAGTHNIELRHLRYFVAVAEAGSFTDAAEHMFMAQPTLSQQLRRLEGLVGTRLLHRRRDGLRLTPAGAVLLETSRTVLSLIDDGVGHARQSAGLDRQRLRMVVPPYLPDLLGVGTVSRLNSAAAAAGIDVTWVEAVLDCEFSLIQQHKADAGLGWLASQGDLLADPLDVMNLGEFEPELWVPSWHPAAARGFVTLEEMAEMDVVYGPRRAAPVIYEAWTEVLRAANPQFGFTEPPFRHSLSICLAFAAAASCPTAVLTAPAIATGSDRAMAVLARPCYVARMVAVTVQRHPLTATAGLVWNIHLPRQLQQILFDTADAVTVVPAAKAG
jgi:DNA-binding transcriptional LysR family regulator